MCTKLKSYNQIKEERIIVLKSPSLAHVEKQKEINKKLLLTNEHLYKNKIRVLTHMGGLFYAGYLSPLQPPDVYAVALDGERGNKSHIMSREEVLKDTVSQISLIESINNTLICFPLDFGIISIFFGGCEAGDKGLCLLEPAI